MAGAGRNDHGITGFQFDDAALIAPETDGCAPASDTEHFMNPRVVVEIIVYPVAPGIDPPVGFK
jgi:hypothetical protein